MMVGGSGVRCWAHLGRSESRDGEGNCMMQSKNEGEGGEK
jgi:hypothetical protein